MCYLPPSLRAILLAAGLAWLAAITIVVDAAGTRSTREGVYSAAQADRGEKTYKARCGTCHMSDQFSGFVFLQAWSGQTAEALYDQLRRTMPKDNPGGLKPQEYADIIAYLFRINRLPAGETDLKGAKPALKDVVIEAPEK
jgi:mono/diheme cytochrome c family protein